MTFTLEFPSTAALVAYGLSLAYLFFIGFSALTAKRLAARELIDIDDFVEHTKKLILANNIDRAIKLCNAQTILVTSAVKSLLVVANKSEEEIQEKLDFAQSSLNSTTVFSAEVGWKRVAYHLVSPLVPLVFLLVFSEANPWFFLVVYLVAEGLLYSRGGNLTRLAAVPTLMEPQLIELRNLLFKRRRGTMHP